MDRLKRKINLIMMVGLCLFATTFGVGASTLINSIATYAETQVVDENTSVDSLAENSDLDAGASANATVIIDGAYYKNKTAESGVGTTATIGGTNLQSDTVHITNSLFEFSSSNPLGSLASSTVEISNSIFVYTGTGTGTVFSGTPTSLRLENVVVFATKGSVNVSNMTATTVTKRGFYYSNKTGNTKGYLSTGGSGTSSINLNTLVKRLPFFAGNAYDVNGDGSDDSLWTGAWNFNDDWAYASRTEVNGSTVSTNQNTGSALYPYPRQYIAKLVTNSATSRIVTLYANRDVDEATYSKIVIGLSGSANNLNMDAKYILSVPGYQQTKWAALPDSLTGDDTVTSTSDVNAVYGIFDERAYKITYKSSGSNNNQTKYYTMDGGTGTGKYYTSYNHYDEVTLTNKLLSSSKTGYVFEGWKPDTNSGNWDSGTKYTKLTSGMYGDVSLTAQFRGERYVINFNANGGKFSDNTEVKTLDGDDRMEYGSAKNNSVSSTIGKPTRTGYTFMGWYDNADWTQGVQVYANNGQCVKGTGYWNDSGQWVKDLINDNEQRSLYARWDRIEYTITFNGNGADSGKMSQQTMQYGVAENLTKNGFGRTGYNFGGWAKSKDAANNNEKLFGDQQKITINEVEAANHTNHTLSLYAIWTPKRIPVTLDGNGGTVKGANGEGLVYPLYSKTTIYLEDDGTATATPTASRNGYTFQGFSTARNSGTILIDANGHLTSNWTYSAGATTLYARWQGIGYTVELNPNGGTGGTTSVRATFGSPMPTINLPTRTGYTFMGFYDTQAQTGGTQYYTSAGASARTWNKAQNFELFARWQGNPISLTVNYMQYNENGDEDSLPSSAPNLTYALGTTSTGTLNASNRSFGTDITAGTQINLTITAPTGYYVSKSELSANPSGLTNKSNTLTISQEMPGTALTINIYVYKVYKITYNPNNGSGATPTEQYVAHGQTIELADNNLKRTGYTANGWNTSNVGNGKHYANGAQYLGTADATLYADWNPLKITFKFNANGGSGEMTNQTLSYSVTTDKATSVKANTFTYTGRHFTGWATSSTGSVVLEDNAPVTTQFDSYFKANNVNQTITLYAKWSIESYTITFYTNNGSKVDPITYNIKSTATLPSSTRSGYTFMGWLPATATVSWVNTITPYPTGTKVTGHYGNVTMNAIWRANVHNVTLDANGGTIDTPSIKVNYGSTYAGRNLYSGYLTKDTRDSHILFENNIFSVSNYTNTSSNTEWLTFSQYFRRTTFVPGETYTMVIEVLEADIEGWVQILAMSYHENSGDVASQPVKRTLTNGRAEVYAETFTAIDLANNSTFTNKLDFRSFVGVQAGDTINSLRFRISVFVGDHVQTENFAYAGPVGTPTSSDIPEPTRKGYTFKGWNTDRNGNGTKITKTSIVNVDADDILYAQWEADEYTISFDADGGVGVSNMKYTAESNSTLPSTTRNGYTFKGWKPTGSVGNWSVNEIYNAGDSVNGKYGNVTLEAQWTPNTYVVNFDATNYVPYPYNNFLGSAGNSTGKGLYSTEVVDNELVVSWTIDEIISVDNQGFGPYVSGTSLVLEEGVEYVWSVDIKSTREHDIYKFGHEMGDRISVDVTTEWQTVTHKITAQANPSGYYAFTFYSRTWAEGEVFQFKNLSVQKVSDIKADHAIGNLTVTFDGKYTNLPTPERAGYEFLGWYTNPQFTGNPIDSDSDVEIAENHTLYSKWEAKNFEVTYNANGGTLVGYNFATAIEDVPETTKNGLTYSYDSSTGILSIDGTPTTNSNYMIVLQSSELPYGLSSFPAGTYSIGYEVLSGSLSFAEAENTGSFAFEFMPANSSQLSTRKVISFRTANRSVLREDSLTLTSDLAQEAKRFVVWIWQNGGGYTFNNVKMRVFTYLKTPVVSTQTVYHDDNAPVGFAVRDGYYFNGWNTEANGAGITYDAGNIGTITEDITLYAQWKAKRIPVAVNLNMGSGSTTPTYTDDEVFVEYGTKNVYRNEYDSSPTTSFVPTRVGYDFAGWYTTASGEGTQLTGSDGILKNNWNLYAGYTNTQYNSFNKVKVFARWTPKRVEVTLKSNGEGAQIAGSTEATIFVEFDSNRVYSSQTGGITTIPVATWENGVYDFFGYWTEEEGGVQLITYTKGGSCSINNTWTYSEDPTTLHAHWTEHAFEIYFSTNGGTFDSSISTDQGRARKNISVEMEEPFTMFGAEDISRPGYVLAGWSLTAPTSLEEPDDTLTADFIPSQDVDPSTDYDAFLEIISAQVLYAVWEPDTFTITYSNGGDSSITLPTTNPRDYKITDSFNLGSASKEGWTFVGWRAETNAGAHTNAEGVTTYAWMKDEIYSNEVSRKFGDITLIATFSENSYTVIFNKNDGSSDSYTQDFTYEEEKALTKNTFTRTGYVFMGWATSTNDDVEFTDGQVVVDALATEDGAEVNLYAVWKAKTYTITLDTNATDLIGTPTISAVNGESAVTIENTVYFVYDSRNIFGGRSGETQETFVQQNQSYFSLIASKIFLSSFSRFTFFILNLIYNGFLLEILYL